jgi:hypothetical protein
MGSEWILGRLASGMLDSTVSGQGSVAGCCECGDEPSGSGATGLVGYLGSHARYALTCHILVTPERTVLQIFLVPDTGIRVTSISQRIIIYRELLFFRLKVLHVST